MPTHFTIAVVSTLMFSLVHGIANARDSEVEQALLMMSKNINKNLPVQIDKEKALEVTVAMQDTLVFKYKFTDEATIKHPRFSRSQYEKHLHNSLRASTCPDAMELLRRGAKFNYVFFDRAGMKVVDYTLDKTQCTE